MLDELQSQIEALEDLHARMQVLVHREELRVLDLHWSDLLTIADAIRLLKSAQTRLRYLDDQVLNTPTRPVA